MKKDIVINDELVKLCKSYKENQSKESFYKKCKESDGKKIKEILGNDFDGELLINTEEFTGKVSYKITISFIADRELIERKGLYDELYKPSQSHPLKIN